MISIDAPNRALEMDDTYDQIKKLHLWPTPHCKFSGELIYERRISFIISKLSHGKRKGSGIRFEDLTSSSPVPDLP